MLGFAQDVVHLWCGAEPNAQMNFTGDAQTFHNVSGTTGAIRKGLQALSVYHLKIFQFDLSSINNVNHQLGANPF